jgi:hypothetical protein
MNMSIMPDEHSISWPGVIMGLAIVAFIAFVIWPYSSVVTAELFPYSSNSQPAPGYYQTYIMGGTWAADLIKSEPTFAQYGDVSTLKLTNTGEPWDTSMPFTYEFLFKDTNGSAHSAVVFIGQDAGSWNNGPFYDGWQNRTFTI